MKLSPKEAMDLLNDYGSPVYVYDFNTLSSRCESIKSFCEYLSVKLCGPKITAHYSTKANSNPKILEVVKYSGLNVDCMSPFEIFVNERSGFYHDEMLYVCNNISVDEMSLVQEKNILICLDSISQVETWGKVFPGTQIMVRINPGVKGVGHSDKVITSGNATKFGICEDNLPELIQTAEKYHLKIVGTHQHLGSLFLNDKIDDYINGVRAGLKIIQKYFPDVSIVDLGGGFGVPYKPDESPLDLMKVADKLVPELKEFMEHCPNVTEFKFEPGRFIPCEAGILLGTVTATKHENGIYWVGTDIGMNQLVRPSMYDSYHEIEVISDTNETVTANICGNVCESGDILGRDRVIKLPKVGDPIIVYNAGAYGYSMASNYTGRPRPAEVMVFQTHPKHYFLIREREDIKHMAKTIKFKC